MLELRQDVRATAQVTVLPQVVARACLLELSLEELEEQVREKLGQNPALEVVETPGGWWGEKTATEEGPDASLARVPAPVSLRDDLRWQLRAQCSGEQRRVAEYIVESLDGRGYLTVSLHEIAEELGVSVAMVEQALSIVQRLEPRGVGARDLAECLRLQVLAMYPSEVPDGLLEFLEGEFADIVRQGDARALQSARLSRADGFMAFIRQHLYPYPADVYQPPFACVGQELPTRTPDATVERTPGGLRVSVPLSERVALRVDAEYERLARNLAGQRGEEGAARIRQLVADARQFIANLAYRHHVIFRVAAGVVAAQQSFFKDGPTALEPLTKKQLAQDLGLHESTVCRATRGKTIMLPEGEIVPLDVFFEEALPAKLTLAQIVRQEDPAHPLTDSELAEQLTARGYPVARRTVSKYRAALGIPAAGERKRARQGG